MKKRFLVSSLKNHKAKKQITLVVGASHSQTRSVGSAGPQVFYLEGFV